MALAAPLIIAGGSLLGGLLGKQGGDDSGASQAAALQAQIAEQLFTQSQGIREQAFGSPGTPGVPASDADRLRVNEINSILQSGFNERTVMFGEEEDIERIPLTGGERLALERELEALQEAQGGIPAVPATTGFLEDFLSTGELPVGLDTDFAFTPARETLESQFTNARENIISNIPSRGGQLNDQLVGLEVDRARSIGAQELQQNLLELPIKESLFNQALQIASGSPVQAASVAGSAGSLFDSINAQNVQSQQQFSQSVGSATSLAAKLALKGPGTTGTTGTSTIDPVLLGGGNTFQPAPGGNNTAGLQFT